MSLIRKILPYLAYSVLASWVWTWKYHIQVPKELQDRLDKRQTVIFAHWHGDELCLLPLIRPYHCATMVSTSKDGQIMHKMFQLFGGATSRGSSTRGAIAGLKGLIRLMKSGRNVNIAVDGPKGPLHVVKPGIFELARLAKAPIYCSGVAIHNPLVFEKSWNKTRFGKPFTQMVINWNGPFYIDKSMDVKCPKLAAQFAQHLHHSQSEALKIIANMQS